MSMYLVYVCLLLNVDKDIMGNEILSIYMYYNTGKELF